MRDALNSLHQWADETIILDDSLSLLNGTNGQPQDSFISSLFCFDSQWRMGNLNTFVGVGFGMVT